MFKELIEEIREGREELREAGITLTEAMLDSGGYKLNKLYTALKLIAVIMGIGIVSTLIA